jgi:hypothetical protein
LTERSHFNSGEVDLPNEAKRALPQNLVYRRGFWVKGRGFEPVNDCKHRLNRAAALLRTVGSIKTPS